MEKSNNTSKIDSIQLKKDRLQGHVPFICQMITKVAGTEFERKWKLMHECIVSDKKK